MTSIEDARYMAEALRLAEKGRYTTHPNPRVGSVIVKHGNIVGRGFHLKAGEGHAEAYALAEAGEAASGSTVYCTLEPCSFHGRTPSCAQALIDAGVSRVVFAMEDPHTKNRGRGHEMLKSAGIHVVGPLMESSARELNPGHIKKFEEGMPYVRLKLGMSFDGKTALANGSSQWITSEAARRDVQKLRAMSSAIVTGVQTVIDDDPSLTVRESEIDIEYAAVASSIDRPIVVLDSKCRMPLDARLATNPNLLVVSTEPGGGEIQGRRVELPADREGRVNLHALLAKLAAMDCNEVLFECGATLAGSLIQEGLADELVIYAAPSLLGADARSLLNLAKIDSMQQRVDLEITEMRRIGDDVRIRCSLG
jgi:diaminohydroxyphosphoribosylaminopyrimidine deaminase/5-amino-6-(5-phosphoribosylamino)uracil reductase